MTVSNTTDWKLETARMAKFNIKMTRKWHKYTYIYFFPAGNECIKSNLDKPKIVCSGIKCTLL